MTRHDALTPFLLEHAAVRGSYVTLPATARAVLACHPYPAAIARVLGELLAACALLASTLKFTGSLIAQLSGDGPVRLLVVECTDALGMRAMAQWDPERTNALGPDATLAALAGGPKHGRLVLTLDPKGAGTMYQGIVALEAGSVGGMIEHYLSTSEQLQSRLVVAARDGAAAGLLLQRLPSSVADDDAAWTRLVREFEAIAPDALLAGARDIAALGAWFPEADIRVFDARPVRARCSCSRERVENALRIAGRDEIEAALAEQGGVEVTCEFCNRRYAFTPDEARAVFEPPRDAAAGPRVH